MVCVRVLVCVCVCVRESVRGGGGGGWGGRGAPGSREGQLGTRGGGLHLGRPAALLQRP